MMQSASKKTGSAFFEVDGPRKLRAARAWLKWNVRETGQKAGISHQYITYYENERMVLWHGDLDRLHAAFLAHGLKVTDNGIEAISPESNEA